MMTESTILDALVYLAEAGFEDEDLACVLDPAVVQRDAVVHRLGTAGFSPCIAEETWAWLHGLIVAASGWRAVAMDSSRRVYTSREERILDADCRAFLEELEALGILDAQHRELILDRALALGQPDLALEDLRWVVFYVLQGAMNSVGPNAEDSWAGPPLIIESDYLH